MKEIDWAKKIAKRLDEELKKISECFHAEPSKKLIYANEVFWYTSHNDIASKKRKHDYRARDFETDILIYESNGDSWKPRIVIETKMKRITTHDVITYSKKSENHKHVHPYLRYGIFIGNRVGIPGRLVRHGNEFDFMISYIKELPSANEWGKTMEVIHSEIEASKNIEEKLYGNKNIKKIFILHRPLVIY